MLSNQINTHPPLYRDAVNERKTVLCDENAPVDTTEVPLKKDQAPHSDW